LHWVLAIQPYAPVYNGLGIISVKRNAVATARVNFEKAVQLTPTHVEGPLNLGIIFNQALDMPCARTAFRAFVDNTPKDYGPERCRTRAALAQVGNRVSR
jgi:Flp pilus assembly protein TadD